MVANQPEQTPGSYCEFRKILITNTDMLHCSNLFIVIWRIPRYDFLVAQIDVYLNPLYQQIIYVIMSRRWTF